ncbi:GyrI-like domain-containing protein [Undibacterium sp.]|uniref:AraC family transcriptional regulator n=1 Tax=Undibacterium sp. TaxID=1914977 RepID=UPI00374DCA10
MNIAAENYAEHYIARFRKVLHYIDAHLEEELDVESLCGIAAFSRYHFHRQFAALFGVGVYEYIQLTRLKRASWKLAFRDADSVTGIALDAGYQVPEAFARAFKKSTGQSPSAFRKQPQWNPWYAHYQSLSELRIKHMRTTYQASQVGIIQFKETRVAVLQHRGDPRQLGDSIRSFIGWRKQNRLPPSMSATFNIAYDDPDTTEAADFRFDLCAATDRDIDTNEQGVIAATIPGGRCAVLRHTGSDDHLGDVARYLYSDWLPHSGEELRDFPIFFQRVAFFPDVPEHLAATDVFLPLK